MIVTCWALVFVQLLSFTGASDSGIVGGKESKPHSRPYMVSLQVEEHHTCGGILIHKNFVLTAAHCKNAGMAAVLGAHNINKKEASQQRIDVAKFIPHPKFTSQNQSDYDIMLLKLKRPAVLNKFVRPIGLPKKDGKIPALINCAVAGWGRTKQGKNKPASKVLKEATEQTQSSADCKSFWQQHFNEIHMICTKFDRKKGGFCQGDSGGPLMCNNKPQGVIAFTAEDKCNDDKIPHVFMKVPFFVPWIKSVMQRF